MEADERLRMEYSLTIEYVEDGQEDENVSEEGIEENDDEEEIDEGDPEGIMPTAARREDRASTAASGQEPGESSYTR